MKAIYKLTVTDSEGDEPADVWYTENPSVVETQLELDKMNMVSEVTVEVAYIYDWERFK